MRARSLIRPVTVACAAAAALTAGTAPVSAAGDTASTPTTVALWHMDEQPGATTMVDSSGHNNDGHIDGANPGAAGMYGSGYGFDGSSSIDFVPDDPSLDPGTAPFTISAWLRVPGDLTVGDYNMLEKGTATAAGGSYKLEIDGTSAKLGRPDCAFHGRSAKVRVEATESIADGTWHHVVCSVTAARVTIAVDGVVQQRRPNGMGAIANTSSLTVGGKPNRTHYYQGLADEVSITIG